MIQELIQLGVVKVEIEYNGSGDEGFVEDIAGYSAEDSVIDTSSVNEELEEWAYDVLEDHYAGWEINEGSSGMITLVPTDSPPTVKIAHAENIIVQNEETVEFKFKGD